MPAMANPTRKGEHKIRENIDALAIAVLMAVLMKYFAIEAYQIPTSSMQPVMMGSKAAGVYDRILVDKSRYILPWNEPERWDVAVFRYPLRRNQPYVKRVVGLPGETLRIAGGNVYRVKEGGDATRPEDLEILRRPDAVLEAHWRNIHPLRADLHDEPTWLGATFQGSGGTWKEANDRLTVEQRNDKSRSTLTFLSTKDGGLVNRVYDGYPAWVAQDMIDAGEVTGAESVQDVRVGFTVSPTAPIAELRITLDVQDEAGSTKTFGLVAAEGKARLYAEVDGDEIVGSEAFDLALTPGDTSLRFTHVDDRCVAEVDGSVRAELDCSAFRTLAALAPSGQGDRGKAVLRIRVTGGGTVAFDDLRIDRDLHYLPTSGYRAFETRTFAVPDGHYFMLGDNTQQSVDSRDWTAMTIGMDADGNLVDPATNPGARVLRGNLRSVNIQDPPDPDENPVVVTRGNKVVFTDENGEVWTLDGKPLLDPSNNRIYGGGQPWFDDGGDGWSAIPQEGALDYEHFVPEEHIIGRPLLTFWPAWPWFRLGFIR
ncbi:MAG: Signal peptidase [Planctomycetota bacterium]